MRAVRKGFFLVLLIISSGLGQQPHLQFYRSKALELFNQGQYPAAIDSMLRWAETYTAERGMAYYYVGESYYNLGLDESSIPRALSFFNESAQYFDKASKQTDLISLSSSKLKEALYKKGWCYYRLAEIENDPVAALDKAVRSFSEAAASGMDTLSFYAHYMVGEAQYRLSEWKRMQMYFSQNEVQALEWAQEGIQSLTAAEHAFQQVIDSRGISQNLRACARLKYQDVLMAWGKLYQQMPPGIFQKITDLRKKESAEITATSLLFQVNYESVFSSLDRLSKVKFEPLVVYSKAIQYLSIYYLTGENQHRQLLNSVLDSLRWVGFQEEKTFLQAERDQRGTVEEEAFFRLTDLRSSFYAKSAEAFPEAWYWLGWAQFVANSKESSRQFSQFLRETETSSKDLRIATLREDAQYRIFLLTFDQNAADQNILRNLRQQMEAFHPQNYTIRNQTDLLLQLVRIGLGEPIWGRILKASTTNDRLRDAFILVRNMLVRATRVTGKERVPYLNYLEKLFEITQERRTQETTFYRGLSLFLTAEIQETAQNKRKYYFSAADALKLSEGMYRNEGMYVQARSYFAAAKHESSPDQRKNVYERAKPIFIRLIREAKSLRSVYYLGEIFRIEGNDLAARKCYDVVMKKTRGVERGAFWYNNAFAGIQNCESTGDTTKLEGIPIENVVFPEALLTVDGEEISLEKFADPDYIRRQYLEEAIDLIMKYGLPKRELYPSVFHIPGSRFNQRAFRIATAGFEERAGTVTTGLQLEVVFPDAASEEIAVYLDGVRLEKDSEGFYRKAPLRLNQRMKIKIESRLAYPFVEEHIFQQPGIEWMTVSLSRRTLLESRGVGLDSGIDIVQFSERLDKNVVFQPENFPVSSATFLYKDFQSDVNYRDFVYSASMDGYLVANSQKENLLFYRNDPMISREGEFSLIFPDEQSQVKSPEGIALDSQGNIYIVDWGKHQIVVFGKDGSYLRSFGSLGINLPSAVGKPVHLMFPTRIAVSEDLQGVLINGKRVYRNPQLFVSDRNGVHLMDTYGNYLDTLISSGYKPGSLYALTVRGYGAGARLYLFNRSTGGVDRFAAKYVESE